MKTEIKRDGEIVTVEVTGMLSFGSSEPLRSQLTKMLSDTTAKKIVFNLERLEFVGSSGISSFIHTLKEFNNRSEIRPEYHNVKSEFKKLIKSMDETQSFDFLEADLRSGVYGARSRRGWLNN